MVRCFSLRQEDSGFVKLIEGRVIKKEEIYCNNSSDLAELINDTFDLSNSVMERVIAIYMNAQCKVLGMLEVARGNNHAAMVSAQSIFQAALLCNAAFFVLTHNHPSGCCTPSREDLILTRKLVQVGSVLDIPIVDHLIIGKNDYWSWREASEK